MSLFESVLASLVVALFMPLFVSLGKESVSLRLSAQSVESSISRDSFISESFSAAAISEIDEWKEMCASLYPSVEISVSEVAAKGDVALYECAWAEHRKLSLKSRDSDLEF